MGNSCFRVWGLTFFLGPASALINPSVKGFSMLILVGLFQLKLFLIYECGRWLNHVSNGEIVLRFTTNPQNWCFLKVMQNKWNKLENRSPMSRTSVWPDKIILSFLNLYLWIKNLIATCSFFFSSMSLPNCTANY